VVKNFEEFVSLWKSETKDIKIKEQNLLFLVVYPDKLEWDFGIEKQTQTTTLMVSGGFTGASTGYDVQFCYRSEVNDFLKNCSHTHAMILSVGMVFDMVGHGEHFDQKWRDDFYESGKKRTPNQVTPITDFYDFVESGEYCKGHIMARPDVPAYLHHQHINLNVDMWKTISCPPLNERWDEFERGLENHHDDYTPYWIKPKDRPMIINFNHNERGRKSFSYYKPWHKDAWKDLDNVDRKEFYFSRFMTRIAPSFYIFNTETFKKIPTENFDVLFSPTAGYSAELLVDKLNFNGEVIMYDYTQDNIDVKETIVDMNMSLDEINTYRSIKEINFVDNTENKPASERTRSMGSHEELRILQEKMRDEQELEYWLMDIINPDYNKISEKVKGKNVFFDTSNIFSYHMSHAYYTLEELVNSYNKLHQTLIESANICWFQGTRPTKQWDRRWIS
jgi:hypothetical protein